MLTWKPVSSSAVSCQSLFAEIHEDASSAPGPVPAFEALQVQRAAGKVRFKKGKSGQNGL